MLDSVEGGQESAPVYNLEVEEYHTYFVGGFGWGFSIWAHNDPLCTKIANKASGDAREAAELADLKAANPSASVQRERYLRTADGKRAIDPDTETARRVDFAVVKDGEVVEMVETTSQNADKAAQIAKENRIREAGGTFIRDKTTGSLIDISTVPTRISRRD